MKTAEEWRQHYSVTRGRTITPCSLLADVFADMEELEAEIRFLKAALVPAEPELTAADMEG